MTTYKAPLDDIRFLMTDVFKMDDFWRTLNCADDLDWETADAVLEEAGKICEQILGPLNREADEQGCTWQEGDVFTPEGFKEAYTTFCEGGWAGLGGNPEYGGMGMPKTMVAAVDEMVQGACIAFGLAPMLTAGACLALDAHGSDNLKSTYLPKMYSGEWSGAMDLTEPHAGTDLGLIRTKAEPLNDGSYQLTGTKIFITWGDHDMANNIVHLVLAKLPDAPAGSRGISLFLVPKFLVNDDGDIGERNKVSCGSLEKKMGIKASATCVMNFDNAKGWLVGEPHKGLACMFTMMNYERLGVGVQGIGVAENSYQNAVAYAKERIQGRSPLGVQTPEKEADNLLVHPDVRRMLMQMKAYNEASRAFYLYSARWLDTAKYGKTDEEKAYASRMVALLTPVTKAFVTDAALETTIHGQQVFGGHGYIREWGQEQHVRDVRITQIYEGTNGVQAMDLVGRKTIMCNGELATDFIAEICQFAQNTTVQHSELLVELTRVSDVLSQATKLIVTRSSLDAALAGSVAVDYQRLFGLVAYAYMWAMMVYSAEKATSSNMSSSSPKLCDAKIKTATYYFNKVLPEVDMLLVRITKGAEVTMALSDDQF